MSKQILTWIAVSVLSACVYLYAQTNPPPIKTTHLKQAQILDSNEDEQAFTYLNHLRFKAGMSPFLHNNALQRAAKKHADYLTYHDKIGHYEEAGRFGFSGVLPKDRVVQAGYKSGMSIENVSNKTLGYKASVDGLFSAIYHRFGFLDFQVDEVGIGVSQNPKNLWDSAYVYDMGIYEINDLCKGVSFTGQGAYTYGVCAQKAFKIKKYAFDEAYNACYQRNKKVVIYPYDGQSDVPPAFFDELPDPLPEYRVSGFPISIQFNPYYFKMVRIKSFELFLGDEKIKETKVYDHISDINSLFKRNEFALFPLKRLKWNKRYRVKVIYSVDGELKTKEWHFKTRKLSRKPIMIDQEKMQVKISSTDATILYFVPKDGEDILGDIEYDAALDITFIDKNTIKIQTKAPKGKTFFLRVSGREIRLVVK